MIKVAAYTGFSHTPSARFRIWQYIDEIKNHGIMLNPIFASVGRRPPQSKLARPFWAVANILENIPLALKSYSYDAVILQREMLPTFSTVEFLTKKPRILDVDDAIFEFRGGQAAKKLASISDCIMCGNQYLANWFSQYNKNIKIVPTAVDSNIFKPSVDLLNLDHQVICWVGSSSGFKYFKISGLEDALAVLFKRYPRLKLRIVADCVPTFNLPQERIEYIKWSPDVEVSVIQSATLGVMPLALDNFALGKCAFKMLTYMACAKPVVVSPYGMNQDVLSKGDVGIGATNSLEWVDAISQILDDDSLSIKFGENGREIILKEFSLNVLANNIASIIKNIV